MGVVRKVKPQPTPRQRIWRTFRQVLAALAVVVPLAITALNQASVPLGQNQTVIITGAAVWFVSALQNAYENREFEAGV